MSADEPHRGWGFVAALIVVSVAACVAGTEESPAPGPAQKPTPRIAGPMGSFARLVTDEWRVTARSGETMFHAWHWGPGQHSIRRMTDGNGANGEPWREVQVYYWEPAREQVRLLVLSPFDRGVGEGTIRFEGETADARIDLHQTKGRRRMAVRWAFDGPDRYHETLLEAARGDDYETLVEFELERVAPPATPRPRGVEGATRPSEPLRVFERLLGRSWEATGAWASGEAIAVRATFEWVPLADAITARVVSTGGDDGPRPLLDAYFYHHTGTGKLRGLVLTDRGGVYEGDVRASDDGGLEMELEGHEGDRAVGRVVRLEFGEGGALVVRVWGVAGAARTSLLEVRSGSK